MVRSSRQSIDRSDDDRLDRAIGRCDEPPSSEPTRQPPSPSRQSLRCLDWFIFFLADVQTGFGPFIAVYLTTQKWTQVEIGFVLSIGGVVALLHQLQELRVLKGRPVADIRV